jgi:eukaryotic-like serine/threonine-protein kinase
VKTLGKYELLSELGRGAMGVVYKARDPLIGRLVAVKTITSALVGKPELLERFYQEARSAGSLQHPNIVAIYELGQAEGIPFIAMEYLEGESLDRIVESRPVLPLFLKLGYILRTCEALDHAHRHGVVHRDIKPANIMVTKDGTVKVVDFGIARLLDVSRTQTNLMIGSRAYMSPQLYKGERADARSDIWAVGITLYELLAFQRPFAGKSEAELMYNILRENPPSLRTLSVDCSEEIEGIIAKMLEKECAARFQTMGDVLRDLEPHWRAAQQVALNGLLEDARELVEAHDLERAQGLLRKALHIDVSNLQAKSLLERVTAQLRRGQLQPRIEEHVTRGRNLLQAGHLREARAEAQAALGLDSKHETAQRLFSEVEEAVAHVQQVEQKLRLAKQRLAEGALSEAATALAEALTLDPGNRQARDFEQQINEERDRREKRKRLAEILHRARSLWAELNYAECLAVLASALRDFPREPELLKLQETARNDQGEEQKRVRLAEIRKLLGEQRFSEALRVVDELDKRYPGDATVESLRGMAQQGLQEQKRSEYLQQQLVEVRSLVNAGQYAVMLSRAERLLKEYPQEFALQELVTYAHGELAFQKQKQRLQEREQHIRDLLQAGRFPEAEEAALQGVHEFPGQTVFEQFQQQAAGKRKEREAQEEIQRRIQAIERNIRKEKLTEAIDLAQQTLATLGPDAKVTRLLNSAQIELGERAKKQEQDQQFEAAKTLMKAGRYADATQLLNQAMAKQILPPSDPRIQQLLAETQRHSTTPRPAQPPLKQPPPAQKVIERTNRSIGKVPAQQETPPKATPPGATMISATQILRPGETPESIGAGRARREDFALTVPAEARRPDSHGGRLFNQKKERSESPAQPPKVPSNPAEMWRRVLPVAEKFIQQPAVPIGLAVLAICVLVAVWWFGKSYSAGPSAEESKEKSQAEQLWTTHELDLSEQKWKQLAQRHGVLQKEAIAQVQQIEAKRAAEKRRFDEGETLLHVQKDYPGAQQAFQEVAAMNLWLSDDARRELDAAKSLASGADIKKQEQDQFEQGTTLFQAGNYEQAGRAFRNVLSLDVPNSPLRSQAETYLKRIRQASIDKKIYESALAEVRNENWPQARDAFTGIANGKGPLASDAKKQLALIEPVQEILETFSQSLNGGSYQAAKHEVEAARPWPKTQGKMSQQLLSAQQQELSGLRSRSQGLTEKGDLGGLEHLQDDLHHFSARAEDSSVLRAAGELDKSITTVVLKLREQSGAKAAFDAAVRSFETAKERGDINQLNHDVIPAFQKIAGGSGAYADAAKQYLKSTIPNAIQQLNKAFAGKGVVPSIDCRGQGSPSGAPGNKAIIECAQLDAGAPLEWVGRPVVDLPDSANKAGKLPYTLHVIVVVDAKGDVKLEKLGTVDNDFFKKAKEAAKHWKTTPPLSGGKPVSVRFPMEISFSR